MGSSRVEKPEVRIVPTVSKGPPWEGGYVVDCSDSGVVLDFRAILNTE